MKFAVVFPGQGSQSVGMLASLAAVEPAVLDTFAEASAVLGYDLWQLCQAGPAESLNATERTQPAMLAAGVAVWRVWRSHGGAMPSHMAGHSLGEFTALVCAGALDFRTAIDVVRFRGQAMQAAVPAGHGAMAAILGLEDADVEAACAAAREGEVVEAVNYNAPGQVVIAGDAPAVARAIEIAKAKGAKRAVPLPVSVPSHSALMLPAAARLRERLASVSFTPPEDIEVVNVDIMRHATVDGIRDALVRQLHSPVRWSAVMQHIVAAGARAIVECGPGKVLTPLNRRIERNKDIRMLTVEDPASLAEGLAAVRG
jgi:[acyl-carrier-protein] S-malonyltransferase